MDYTDSTEVVGSTLSVTQHAMGPSHPHMQHGHKDIISLEAVPTLDSLFRERVRRTPQRVAYRSFDKADGVWVDTTWEAMAAQVGRWQTGLSQLGLEPGDRVAVLMRNCREWVCFDQAALGLGLTVVPLYVEDRADNVAFILQDAGVKLLLIQDLNRWRWLGPAVESLKSLRHVLINVKKEDSPNLPRARYVADWLPEQAAPLSLHSLDRDRLATIVYTSGTTGRPKGVMLSHANILSVAHAVLSIIDVYQEDLFLSFLPLSHTTERTGGYYLPLMAGSTVAYARSIAHLAEDLRTLRPTLIIAVPRIFERVYSRIQTHLARKPVLNRWLFGLARQVGWHRFQRQQGQRGWTPELLLWPLLSCLVTRQVTAQLGGRLRAAVCGGAALPPEVSEMFISLGVMILQGYGLTETSPVISVNLPEDNDPTSVGLPIPGVEVRIGAGDELLVRGPGIMLGYWNNEAATRQVIDSEGWLHTGDQARIADNHLYIIGRLKDVLVLSNGEKVPPGDMESKIILDPLIEQAMVVGEGKAYLVALLVLNTERFAEFARPLGLDPTDPLILENSQLQQKVITQVNDRIRDFPGYAKIRRVCLLVEPWTIENGLLTPTLKIKRNEVLKRFAQSLAKAYSKDGGVRL